MSIQISNCYLTPDNSKRWTWVVRIVIKNLATQEVIDWSGWSQPIESPVLAPLQWNVVWGVDDASPVIHYTPAPDTHANLSLIVDGNPVPFYTTFSWPTGETSLTLNIERTVLVNQDGQNHLFDFRLEELSDISGSTRHSSISTTRFIPMSAAPSNITVSFRRVVDPFTKVQTNYEILAIGASLQDAQLKVSAAVDGVNYTPATLTALSPTMAKINGVVIPRDALSHVINIKWWTHDSGVNEDSTPLLMAPLLGTFDLAPPVTPTAVTATLLRDGSGEIPDQIRMEWTSSDPVDIYLIDSLNVKRKIDTALAHETSLIVENSRRFGTQNGVAQSYKFGVSAFNRSGNSEICYAEPVMITAGQAATVPQTPDQVAGTAVTYSQPQLVTALATELTGIDATVIASVLNGLVHRVKHVLAAGGTVSLNDFGQLTAEWTVDKINTKGILVPGARSGAFIPSVGFSKGVKLGQVLSDTEAALLK